MTWLSGTVEVLAGVPTREAMAPIIRRLFDPKVITVTGIDGGVRLTSANAVEAVVDHAMASPREFIGIDANHGREMSISWRPVPGPVTGGLSIHGPIDDGFATSMVELLTDVVELSSAPLGTVSHQLADAPPDQYGGYRQRRHDHLLANRAAHAPQPAQYGLFCGLAGIAWRTILGPTLVEFFGLDRLNKLPSKLATCISPTQWLLSPCEQPQDWSHDRYCDGEAEIIDALGPEHFYNPDTGALPTVVPEIPHLAPYPTTTWDAGTDTWVENPGGTRPSAKIAEVTAKSFMFGLVHGSEFTPADVKRYIDSATDGASVPDELTTSDTSLRAYWTADDQPLVIEFRWFADEETLALATQGLGRHGVTVDQNRLPASAALFSTTQGPIDAPTHINFLIELSGYLEEHPALTMTIGDPTNQ